MILVISYQVLLQKISNSPTSQGGLFSLISPIPLEAPVELHTFLKNLPLSAPRPPQTTSMGWIWVFLEPHTVILLPLHPVTLTHKNPQRQKIIHGTCPTGCKHRSIDLNMCFCRNILFRKFLWQLLWLSFNETYFF